MTVKIALHIKGAIEANEDCLITQEDHNEINGLLV
jgi:hypothetical protein